MPIILQITWTCGVCGLLWGFFFLWAYYFSNLGRLFYGLYNFSHAAVLRRAFCSPLPTQEWQISCPNCLPVAICFLSRIGTGVSWPMEPVGVLRGCPGIVTGRWGQEQLPALESPTLQPLSCCTRTLTQLPPCSKYTIQLRFPALRNFRFLWITNSSSLRDRRWDFRKKECFFLTRKLAASSLEQRVAVAGASGRG